MADLGRRYDVDGMLSSAYAVARSGEDLQPLSISVIEDDVEMSVRRQLAELEYLVSSTAAMTSLAENYAGLPIGF